MSDPRLGYAYSYGAEPSGFVGAAPPSAAGAVWRGTGAPRTRELGRSDAAVPLAWNAQQPFGAGLAAQQHTLRQPPPGYGRSYGGTGVAPYASSGYSDDEGSAGSDADEAFSDEAGSDDDDGVVYSDDENGDGHESARGSWGGAVYGAAPPQSSWW
ncbi:hypothetical protein pmac_cds_26 [Pandoravirus macleodensis]|uniref:Uncharacterized protein n=1 Tax=Pandoravirus macleodensis TaxID=2107707 RepID=A0A2U7UE52_9VIRU|nr:hypothetical protein pmac_cds_26 [Pandoravirus macleodensis]AVK76714.1 hypothetical protein pmac_cds_26 [Pandoravirus macleodensis]UMO79253.1 hypothetical protein [Pandoravirus aubagnensis]